MVDLFECIQALQKSHTEGTLFNFDKESECIRVFA